MNDISTSTDQPAKNVRRFRFFAFLFVYAVIVKVFPWILLRSGLRVEDSFAFYPWNLTPLFAIGLFSGAFYSSRLNSVLATLAMMFVADIGIWIASGDMSRAIFYPGQWGVYLALAICPIIGFSLRSNRNVFKVIGCVFGTGLTFFLVSNFAVWVAFDTYPHTLDGLITCYARAIPFAKNDLLGTAVVSSILFSPMCVRIVSESPAESRSSEEFKPATVS